MPGVGIVLACDTAMARFLQGGASSMPALGTAQTLQGAWNLQEKCVGMDFAGGIWP